MKALAKSELAEIESLHNDILNAGRTTLRKAIRIGEILATIKAKTKHGDWLPMVESMPFSQETAANYMRLHENRDNPKLATVANLKDAVKLIADKKPRGRAKAKAAVIDIESSRAEHAPEASPADKPANLPAAKDWRDWLRHLFANDWPVHCSENGLKPSDLYTLSSWLAERLHAHLARPKPASTSASKSKLRNRLFGRSNGKIEQPF